VVEISELLVVQVHLVQDGGHEIRTTHLPLDGAVTEFVRGAVDVRGLEAAAGNDRLDAAAWVGEINNACSMFYAKTSCNREAAGVTETNARTRNVGGYSWIKRRWLLAAR
jgi:hypothetical protein